MDYYRKWFQHLFNIEEQKRKNLKQQANLKSNANKLLGKKDDAQNMFRQQYRYNYVNWLKNQEHLYSSGGVSNF